MADLGHDYRSSLPDGAMLSYLVAWAGPAAR